MTDKPFRLALLQMEAAAGDIAANLGTIEAAAVEAVSAGAACLVAPELALTGYGAGEAIQATAEPADGGQVARLQTIVAETGIAIVGV